MEALYPDGLTERSEELAYHFRLAGVWDKAFDYLTRSGDKARQVFANQEAITFYTQAIEVGERITPALDAAQCLPVYEGRGLVWMLLTKYDEAIADFEQMRQMAHASQNPQKEGESLGHLAFAHWGKFSEEHIPFIERYAQEAMQLFQRTGDQKTLARSLTSLAFVHQAHGNLQESNTKLEEVLRISRREGFKDSLTQGLLWRGAHAYWQGDFSRAIQLIQEGLAVARDIQDGINELFNLAFLCLACWSAGDYTQALTVLYEGQSQAKKRGNQFIFGRLVNTHGWFHGEFGDVSHAIEYNQESLELGRIYHIANVEISALINLGLDHIALGQHERALSYLEPTLDRVQREAFGSHSWRWKSRLHIGLAELSCMTRDYEQALRHIEHGLQEAQGSSSQKYVALGWALRGKIAAKSGDIETAGTELQRAFTLADHLQSPSLIYPIAYALGQWHESVGHERDAATMYGKAKSTINQMATAVGDEALRSTFLQSALVQEIHEQATRLIG